jgi:hypothetical protein
MATVHLSNISEDDSSERLGVHVELKDGEDLREKLLLMQIVKLEGGVHSVDHGVLMNKSRELLHNGGDQASGVAEVVHNMAARNNVMLGVQAIVESGNTINVVDLMDGNSVMYESMLNLGLKSGLGSSLFGDGLLVSIDFFLGSLYEGKRR